MRRKTLCVWALLAWIAAPPVWAQSDDRDSGHEYCGTNIPPDEASGFVPLPEGDVFCPLIADPKSAYSYAAYVRGSSSSPLGTDLGSVGIADRFGLARWGGSRPGEGIQLSLEGSVFAQFDLNTPSYDLINADYLVGAPVTFRWRGFSARARVYHQSSHLGDEFVLRSRIPRENFAFQSGEVILSYDLAAIRVYGGGEYFFNATPSSVETWLVHGGLELRQRQNALRLGSVAGVRLVAAGDVKSIENLDWETAYSARAGFEVTPPSATRHASRRWSVLGHYYFGPSPYGQFFRSDVKYYGVGIHFAL